MALTALDIYKLLPKTNCKECGFPTCLAFAMQVAGGKAGIDKCPTASDDAKEKLGAAAAPPLPIVTIGAGERAVTLGDEVVLYRHEKAFYHPTAIAIPVSDAAQDEALAARLAAIRAQSFERVGQAVTIDLAAVRFDSGDPARFAAVAGAAHAKTGLPLVLRASAAALGAASEAVGSTRPLLWAPPGEADAAARIAGAKGLPLAVSGAGLEEIANAAASARAAGVTGIVAAPTASSVREALAASTAIRTLAIAHRAREIAFPTAFDLGGRFPDPFAAACLLIPKFGSLLILDSVDPAEILPLLTLRQNIFTDPQRPIQVEPGVYPIGHAGPSSPVLVTTNFSLTYFTVRGDIEAAKVPAHLLVEDCDGMSVLTAWAAGKLTPESVSRTLSGEIAGRVGHRTIVIPGLVARLSGKIEEVSGWRVLVGPQESSALPSYLRRLPPAAFSPVNG